MRLSPVLSFFQHFPNRGKFWTQFCVLARGIFRGPIPGTLAALGLIFIIAFYSLTPQIPSLSSSPTISQLYPVPPPQSKHAFVVFVGGDYENNLARDDQDTYFVGARVLIYQLLHAPRTQINTSFDVVVLATTNVTASKLVRLASDGARVLVVDRLSSPWIKSGEPRWADVLTKLRACALTEYEKILLLDSDMLLVDRLDGVFADPATEPQAPNLTLADSTEPALPATYMLAAQPIQNQRVHPYPPDRGDYFSSGFFLCQPSVVLYQYYLNLTTEAPGADDEGGGRKPKFDPFLPEQNLLNYAHRRHGPMPWSEIHYTWTTTWPSWREVAKGAKSLHEKWWRDDLPGVLDDAKNQELQRWWWRVRWEMDGFYWARDGIEGAEMKLGMGGEELEE